MDNGQDRNSIRPFDWRDLLLVQRLQAEIQVLDYERARVDGVSPLRDALHAYLLPGGNDQRTLVMPGRNAFIQCTWPKGSDQVRLTYLAPPPINDDYAERWTHLLEQLTAAVGAQGIHHVVTEASHDGAEMELLRRVGFGVVTRQMLFRLSEPSATANSLPPLSGLRPWQSKDDWGLRVLHTNTVPHLVQQIETAADSILNASYWSGRLVLERESEIIACIAIRRGRIGNAMRLLLHPEADVYVEALIQHGLAALTHVTPLPVYCRVRRYESWLQAPLVSSGFEPMARSVLLVKHTVARVLTPEWQRLPALKGQAEITTPVARARLGRSLRL